MTLTFADEHHDFVIGRLTNLYEFDKVLMY